MLDLESLGTRPDCAILTLGAIKFDPFRPDAFGDSLYLRIDVDQQLSLGREVQADTLEWWSRQADDVREEALGEHDRVGLEEMYRQLNKFTVGVNNIWCQGPAFDIVILENIYRQMGWPTPWQFWQIRDSRTLFGVHGDPRVKGKAGLHNALEDCISQAKGVQEIYNKLSITKNK
jgi:hypothetical protein